MSAEVVKDSLKFDGSATGRRRRRRSSSSRSVSPVVPEIRGSRDRGSDGDKPKRRRRQSSSSRSVSPKPQGNKDAKSPDGKPADHPNNAAQALGLLGRTGGAYIPPARLRQMQAKITDKSSDAYQRIAWEALKKSIHGLINKVNVANIAQVVRQLLTENIVRGRGLLVKSLITCQMASPTFTHIFAALIAIVNTKFPHIGELLLKRLVNEFRKAFRRNQKDRCLTTAKFLAHLVNQKVAHELVVLELLTLLLEQTTDDSVEVSVALLKECGMFLARIVPKGLAGIFDHLRKILNESQCDKRIAYMIEVLFQIRRDGWKDHPTVLPELDLVEEDDQITHTLSLTDAIDTEDALNIYHFDPDFEQNERNYAQIRESIFENDDDDGDSGSGTESEGSGSSDSEDGVKGPNDEQQEQDGVIIDQTETNLVHLRRTIYLMLQSSISADESAHRLLQLKIKPGEEYEVASMVLDCCAQTRSYESRYGALGQRLCRVMLFSGDKPKPGDKKDAKPKPTEVTEPPRTYVSQFEKIFGEQYLTIHRLETVKLKNVAMFFAHLLYTDSISWGVLECVKLNERDTSSSGRIFLKYLFQELCSYMGLTKLQERLRDETLAPFFVHLLPRDNPKDTRFAINFLTTIGLGGLTIDLREHLQATKEKAKELEAAGGSSSSSSSSGSSSDSDSDSQSSGRSSSSSSSSRSSSSSSASSSGSSSSSESEDEEEKQSRNKESKRGHSRDVKGKRNGKELDASPEHRRRRPPSADSDGKCRSKKPREASPIQHQAVDDADEIRRNVNPSPPPRWSAPVPPPPARSSGRGRRSPSPPRQGNQSRYDSPPPSKFARGDASPTPVDASRRRRASPSPPKRSNRLNDSPPSKPAPSEEEAPQKSRRRNTPSPPRRSNRRYDSPPSKLAPSEEAPQRPRRRNTPTPPRNNRRYDSPPSKLAPSKEVAPQKSRRRNTPTPPRRNNRRYDSPPSRMEPVEDAKTKSPDVPRRGRGSPSPKASRRRATPTPPRRSNRRYDSPPSRMQPEVGKPPVSPKRRRVSPSPPPAGRSRRHDSPPQASRPPRSPDASRRRNVSPPPAPARNGGRRYNSPPSRLERREASPSSSPPKRANHRHDLPLSRGREVVDKSPVASKRQEISRMESRRRDFSPSPKGSRRDDSRGKERRRRRDRKSVSRDRSPFVERHL